MTDTTRYSAPARYPRQIIAMISDDRYADVEAERVDRGVSRSEILRDALDTYFASVKS